MELRQPMKWALSQKHFHFLDISHFSDYPTFIFSFLNRYNLKSVNFISKWALYRNTSTFWYFILNRPNLKSINSHSTSSNGIGWNGLSGKHFQVRKHNGELGITVLEGSLWCAKDPKIYFHFKSLGNKFRFDKYSNVKVSVGVDWY